MPYKKILKKAAKKAAKKANRYISPKRVSGDLKPSGPIPKRKTYSAITKADIAQSKKTLDDVVKKLTQSGEYVVAKPSSGGFKRASGGNKTASYFALSGAITAVGAVAWERWRRRKKRK